MISAEVSTAAVRCCLVSFIRYLSFRRQLSMLQRLVQESGMIWFTELSKSCGF